MPSRAPLFRSLVAGVLAAGPAALAAPPPAVIVPAATPQLLPVLAVRSAAPVRSASIAAPMPDDDASAPIVAADNGAVVKPAMFWEKQEFSGNGMLAGSDDHERKMQPASGVKVDVPLD